MQLPGASKAAAVVWAKGRQCKREWFHPARRQALRAFFLFFPAMKTMLESTDIQRLETARNIWLATVRPNGSPHLVPIWFVWHANKVYICTAKSSVKARNILKHSKIALALEDGDDPLVIEGEAAFLDQVPAELVSAFQSKFDWDIRTDETYNTVIEITPTRPTV